ncbi:acetylxylan esterase [Gemella haemolysans]|uniref:Acetylxylan esterase n=1 Tax=Gemella haemolysans TaxID=1379 RepID=A0AAW6B464_9BACL|nr:acetylxylan esterase [Gemella haemolysans]MDB6186181.1 acetylxylan esterase [Gemella haemolysans]
MKLERERELNYKVSILKDYAEMQLLSIEFDAIDNSKIHTELVMKKANNKGIILEIPDYEEVPSSEVNLMKYCVLGYSCGSLHVRGDRGRSENKQSASIYFPFLNNNSEDDLYYNYAYQDGIDLVNVFKREFPDLQVTIVAKGQGAAIGIVTAAVGKKVQNLFISNVQNTDFKFIFDNNLDVGVYDGIREYNRNYPEKEDYLLEMLEKIDVLNYAEDVEAEIYFGYSSLDDERNIVIHKKLASLFKRKKVTVFEYEDLNIHEKLIEGWMIN